MNTPETPPPIPPEYDRWNWGGFFLSWIWGLGNGVFVALLALIPVVNIVMMVILGARGSAMAWAAGGWRDPIGFQKTQRVWAWVGAGVWAFFLVVPLAIIVTILVSIKSHPAYDMGLEALHRDAQVAEVFGEPLEPGWFATGSLKSSGASGSADLTIPISGPRASGDAHVIAEKIAGVWELRSVQVLPSGGDLITVLGR